MAECVLGMGSLDLGLGIEKIGCNDSEFDCCDYLDGEGMEEGLVYIDRCACVVCSLCVCIICMCCASVLGI